MRFVLTPVGSAGDVHPFVGIGRGLQARGHEVIVVTAAPFADAVRQAGLSFHPTVSEEEFDRVTRNPDLWHPRRGLQVVLREVAARLRLGYDCLNAVHEPGRTVLVGHALSFATRVFEELHGVPAATLHLAPSVFRSDHAQPAYAPGRDGSNWPWWLKRGLWWAIDRLMLDPNVVPALNAWRRELGLPPVDRIFRTWIHSPRRIIALFPEWFAPRQPDWPPPLRFTGFPLYDGPAGTLPGSLRQFLERGTAPILFTPGSANRSARQFFDVALDAATRLGRRALLLTRYDRQIPELPPTAHHETFVPLAAVLPHCAALVSHGGIGTIAQGLAAGVPQLTMPMGFDQPDNATRLRRLGVGRWIVPSRFDGSRVAATLSDLLGNPHVASSCRHWSSHVHARNSIGDTCDLLEQLA